jgi:hypothetical protein
MASGYQLTPAEQAAVAENGSARDKAAAASGQFAQTFNQPIANQGVRAGATQVTPTQAAPSKASAAPVAGSQDIFTGLCDALNQNQQDLVKSKKRAIADEYVILFAPSPLGASTIKRPGDQNLSQAPMQNNATAADKLIKEKNSVNRNAITWPVTAGTQIVQLIDNVMRCSSYITDQQIVQVSPVADPVTGVQKQVPSPGTGKPPAWYKISVAAEDLGVDKIINDHAYRMTFIISAYQPAQLISEYFPDSKYRGVHKSYQYWFTGENTQILSYEQKYDNAYRLALSGIGVDTQKSLKIDWRDQNRKIYVATSENHAQGAKDYTNEPADNAASFLYDPKSLSTVKLRIVGDPAWLQQGECGLGISAKTFNFNPFNADGTINFDSQAVMFDVSFNQPVDYNFSTGIMDTNTMNRQGLPQEHYTFTAIECKSTFSKGRFEQEITGKLLTDELKAATAQTGGGRPATPNNIATAAGSRERTTAQDEAQDLENGANAGTGTGTTDAVNNTAGQAPASPQPASPPGAPNSDGSIVGGSDTPAPPKIDINSPIQANAEEAAAVQAYVAAGGTFPRGTGPITSGPLYDAVLSAKSSLAARQQASAVNTTPSQVIAKDDS